MAPRDVTLRAARARALAAEAQRAPKLQYLLVGEPPLAIAAEEVRRVVPEADYAGRRVELSSVLGTAPGSTRDRRVLVVGRGPDELGLIAFPPIRTLEVTPAEVLVLPPEVARTSCMSCVVAPAGVPTFFVLDLARVREFRIDPLPTGEDTDP